MSCGLLKRGLQRTIKKLLARRRSPREADELEIPVDKDDQAPDPDLHQLIKSSLLEAGLAPATGLSRHRQRPPVEAEGGRNSVDERQASISAQGEDIAVRKRQATDDLTLRNVSTKGKQGPATRCRVDSGHKLPMLASLATTRPLHVHRQSKLQRPTAIDDTDDAGSPALARARAIRQPNVPAAVSAWPGVGDRLSKEERVERDKRLIKQWAKRASPAQHPVAAAMRDVSASPSPSPSTADPSSSRASASPPPVSPPTAARETLLPWINGSDKDGGRAGLLQVRIVAPLPGATTTGSYLVPSMAGRQPAHDGGEGQAGGGGVAVAATTTAEAISSPSPSSPSSPSFFPTTLPSPAYMISGGSTLIPLGTWDPRVIRGS